MDDLGDHYGACIRSGHLQRQAAYRRSMAHYCILQEAGGRDVRKRLLREVIAGLPDTDGRNIDAWALGRRIRRVLPLAVDATLGSMLRSDWEAIPAELRGGTTFPDAEHRQLTRYHALEDRLLNALSSSLQLVNWAADGTIKLCASSVISLVPRPRPNQQPSGSP